MLTLSAALRRVKAPLVPLLASVFLSSGSGCGTIVARDRASSRPDTVSPANLVGPYEGQVLERETGKPIAGALVVGSFSYSRGVGFRAPAGASVVESHTDEDGRYRIEAPPVLPTGPSVRLDRFTLIVYQHGFVAYRSDRELDGLEVRPRRNFTQQGNKVVLTKLDAATGHQRHLEFLGVWGAPEGLAKALVWEFEAVRKTNAAGTESTEAAEGDEEPEEAQDPEGAEAGDGEP